ncbi:hypothetical protein K3Z84_28490, partial [Pseudomonas aeruginosa]|nr:hypothetical protein [Pseudomonas aeruginosa]
TASRRWSRSNRWRCLALEAFQRASPERQPDYLPD